MKKRLTVVVVLLLTGLIAIGCGTSTVATVNGEKVDQAELDRIINLYVAQAKQVYNADVTEDQELMKEIEKAALNDLIDQTLVIQKAISEGLKATEKEVKDAIRNFKESSGAEGYKKFLKDTGMTDKDFEQEMYNQVLVGELHDKVVAKVKVSEDEIRAYYEAHPEDFGNLRELKVSHILLKTREEAEEVIDRIHAGEDFGTLAKELSIEPAAKESKGDLGFINEQTNFVTEFKEAALKLKPGEMTEEPVKSQFGYHVIKAFEEKEAHVEPFDEVRDQAEQLAKQAKEQQVWTDFVANLRKQADIEIKSAKK
ncbi:MAG: SurA N-terminal domain-containing protein [Bacillota bacterium]